MELALASIILSTAALAVAIYALLQSLGTAGRADRLESAVRAIDPNANLEAGEQSAIKNVIRNHGGHGGAL